MIRLITELLKISVIIFLPFIILLRSAVEIHQYQQMPAFIPIAGGALVATIILHAYFTVIYSHYSSNTRSFNSAKRRLITSFFIVMVYVIYSIFYLSLKNTQSTDVYSQVYKTHPIIRQSVSTLIFLDKDLIINDGARKPEDYKKMGLKENSQSLHYVQDDGYSYALDLRTKNRSSLRNLTMEWYFKIIGFNTLRHQGTGDHLHISLPCHFKPGGI